MQGGLHWSMSALRVASNCFISKVVCLQQSEHRTLVHDYVKKNWDQAFVAVWLLYKGLTFDLNDSASGWSRGYYSSVSVFQLTETESTQATADIYDKEASIQIDYSPLREDLKVI